MTNQSNFKFEGNNIAYKALFALDGWNYFTYNKNINKMAINTYQSKEEEEKDIFILIVHFLNNYQDSLKFKYDTKEECLADRDKLLDYIKGDNHQIKESINIPKNNEILELLEKEDIDEYSLSNKVTLSKLKNYFERNDYLFPTVDSLVKFYTPKTFHKFQNAAIGIYAIYLLHKILKKKNIIWDKLEVIGSTSKNYFYPDIWL